MNYRALIVFAIVALVTIAFWVGVVWLTADVFADVERWNCENIKTHPHPIPMNISTDDNGNWDVLLADGSVLYGERFDGYMKWQWQDSWWHTNGIDVVYCESDVKALSILMAKSGFTVTVESNNL